MTARTLAELRQTRPLEEIRAVQFLEDPQPDRILPLSGVVGSVTTAEDAAS